MAVFVNGVELTGGGGATWESKSANFTAAASKNYLVDTSSNTVTATLPGSASAGRREAPDAHRGFQEDRR